ncbi:MAG: LysR family transcriptional regulator [Polyangiaceae bacterium]|nr:LysR family transcriptional regulator [Polyangiaceae bacterium]
MNEVPELELLAIFDAIHQERHLTRAAARVGKSQPSVSRALAQMRHVFGDQLFVRTPRGVVPTERADALAPEVRKVLDSASALVHARRFSAATLQRTMVIGTSDFAEAQILPRLMRALGTEAPGVNVVTKAIPPEPTDYLADGRLDLVFVTPASTPPAAMAQPLFEDSFLGAARRDHPAFRRPMTLEKYTDLPHIQVAPRGNPGGPIDDALAALGHSRRIAVRTPSFLAALALLSQSDFVIAAPKTVLFSYSNVFQLKTFNLPIEVSGFKIVQAWHKRAHEDPAHKWFRALVARVAREMRRAVDEGKLAGL